MKQRLLGDIVCCLVFKGGAASVKLKDETASFGSCFKVQGKKEIFQFLTGVRLRVSRRRVRQESIRKMLIWPENNGRA